MITAIKPARYTFRSHGKLLLTGEYLVLNGARALALPLGKEQIMEIGYDPGLKTTIDWLASDPEGSWFKARLAFDPLLTVLDTDNHEVAGKLVELLNAAKSLNPDFLTAPGNYYVNNHLTFNRNWGWGSSSTLISNLARWAGADPFALNRLVFGGSGYDIACARSDSPLLYRLASGKPEIREIPFHPSFHEHIAFIHLGVKQDTPMEIKGFNPDPALVLPAVAEISAITSEIAATTLLTRFNSLIERHESIIGHLLNRPAIQSSLFADFNGSIKSLGAWGGDFIMASSPDTFESTVRYFRARGFPVSFSWKEIIR